MADVRQAGDGSMSDMRPFWDSQMKFVPEENIFIISSRITLRLNHMHDQGSPLRSVSECISMFVTMLTFLKYFPDVM